MSLTPATIPATRGDADRTSRSKRARISSARSPFTPRLRTRQSWRARMSQYAYWLVASPAPSGGASGGGLNPGGPAVGGAPSAAVGTGTGADTGPAPFAKLGV